MLVLLNNGVALEGVAFDTMVGSYILRADGNTTWTHWRSAP